MVANSSWSIVPAAARPTARPTTRIVFFLLLLVGILLGENSLCLAETFLESDIDFILDPFLGKGNLGGLASEPFAQNIHGSGYLNFAELRVDYVENNNVDTDLGILPKSLDAAVVFLKTQLLEDSDKTNWFSQSIGEVASDWQTYFCCTTVTQKLFAANVKDNNNNDENSESTTNLCQEDQIGQLIINKDRNPNIVRVEHRNINITAGFMGMEGVISVDETEHMVLVFGYCDDIISSDHDATVKSTIPALQIHGKLIWVSYVSGSTLPLYVVLAVITAGLALWYHRLMTVHADARIKVEEWILLTLRLAAFAAGLQTVLIAAEVYLEDEHLALKLLSDVVKSLAAAASRCLYLVLALGLGVITSSLSKTTDGVLRVCLGLYVVGLFGIDSMDVVERGPFIAILEEVVLVLDIAFLVWIPCSLCATMRYLNRNNEELKLVRYRWILRIYFLTIALSVVQIGLFFWDMIQNGGRNYDLESVREGNQVIQLIILACIAYLWKPNPSQQQYAYVLLDGDDEEVAFGDDYNGENNTTGLADLELTEVVKEEEVVIEENPNHNGVI